MNFFSPTEKSFVKRREKCYYYNGELYYGFL